MSTRRSARTSARVNYAVDVDVEEDFMEEDGDDVPSPPSKKKKCGVSVSNDLKTSSSAPPSSSKVDLGGGKREQKRTTRQNAAAAAGVSAKKSNTSSSAKPPQNKRKAIASLSEFLYTETKTVHTNKAPRNNARRPAVVADDDLTSSSVSSSEEEDSDSEEDDDDDAAPEDGAAPSDDAGANADAGDIERVLALKLAPHAGAVGLIALVKRKRYSWRACDWIAWERVWAAAATTCRAFLRRMEMSNVHDAVAALNDAAAADRSAADISGTPTVPAPRVLYSELDGFICPETGELHASLLVAERAVAYRTKPRRQVLIKWEGCDLDAATWEDADTFGREADKDDVTRNDASVLEALDLRENMAKAMERLTPPPDTPATEWPDAQKEGDANDADDDDEPPRRPTKLDGAARLRFHNGRELRHYQVDGVDWMLQNYRRKRGCILGDEMGLGKTAQTVALIEAIRRFHNNRGPFLIVAPLSTLQHWRRECETWAGLNVAIYAGSAASREICRRHEFRFAEESLQTAKDIDSSKGETPEDVAHLRKVRNVAMKYETDFHRRIPKFDILITTYDALKRDSNYIAKFHYTAVVADEAHTLKDRRSVVSSTFGDLSRDWTLLLTGTPVQNHVREVHGLLCATKHHPTVVYVKHATKLRDLGVEVAVDASASKRGGQIDDDVEEAAFLSNYDVAASDTETVCATKVQNLKDLLKPILLRREKDDVEQLPVREEVVVRVELTKMQRHYYNAVYKQNVAALMGGGSYGKVGSLNNIAMQLRKASNHPFLLDTVEDQVRHKYKDAAEKISDAEMISRHSGKTTFLAKLLPQLQRDGHRVLIFSQFVKTLDILSRYLASAGFSHERLDGNTSALERQMAIDRFSRDEGASFCFLLSTRAGGVGITLTRADICIIFDSDWNPQNDLQAMARCHRIGQTRDVTVYRLVTKDTYEEHLFETSSRKQGLEEALLRGNLASNGGSMSAKEVQRLLQLGAHHSLMAEKAGEQDEQAKVEGGDAMLPEKEGFEAETIETILSGRTERRQIGGKKNNTFSMATFGAEEEGEEEGADEEGAAAGRRANQEPEEADEYWRRLLPEEVEAAKKRAAGLQDLGVRERRKVTRYVPLGMDEAGEHDSDLSMSDDDGGDGSDGSGGKNRRKRGGDKKKKMDGWRDVDVSRLEECLWNFGVDRTEEVRAAAKLTHIPLEDVERAEKALVSLWEAAKQRHAREKATRDNLNNLPGPGPEGFSGNEKILAKKAELQAVVDSAPARAAEEEASLISGLSASIAEAVGSVKARARRDKPVTAKKVVARLEERAALRRAIDAANPAEENVAPTEMGETATATAAASAAEPVPVPVPVPMTTTTTTTTTGGNDGGDKVDDPLLCKEPITPSPAKQPSSLKPPAAPPVAPTVHADVPAEWHDEQVDAHLLLAAHVHGLTYDSRCGLANVRAAYSRALTDYAPLRELAERAGYLADAPDADVEVFVRYLQRRLSSLLDGLVVEEMRRIQEEKTRRRMQALEAAAAQRRREMAAHAAARPSVPAFPLSAVAPAPMQAVVGSGFRSHVASTKPPPPPPPPPVSSGAAASPLPPPPPPRPKPAVLAIDDSERARLAALVKKSKTQPTLMSLFARQTSNHHHHNNNNATTATGAEAPK
ncbi:chromodomain-helicase-DNA-binding protein [Pycnococcus provasolii]